MKHPAKTKVDVNDAIPSWEADAKLDDLTKLTPSRPEQHGDLVFGDDGKPTGIYVVTNATTKFTRRDASLMIDGELDFDGPNPFGERALDIYGQAVGQIESGNRYDITGGYNNHYQGRYQMGRDALADVGVGFTAADREAFLADPEAQDAAFRAFTLQNHATLSRLSRRYREMPRAEQLGILGYAHNQGAGSALDYLRTGVASRDGFGTKPEIYISAVMSGLAAGQAQLGDNNGS